MKRFRNAGFILFLLLLGIVILSACQPVMEDDPTQGTTLASTAPTTHTLIPVESTQTTVPDSPTEAGETLAATLDTAGTEPTSEVPHEHYYEASYTVAPNCTDQGYTLYRCSCGIYFSDHFTDATGHSWSEWAIISEPTIESEGEETRFCQDCEVYESRPLEKLSSAETVSPETTDPDESESVGETETVPDVEESSEPAA